MSGLIPQTFVDELLSRIDIVELIDQYVPLKPQGRDHSACCPFHDEKTPSFTVSREKQFYYCFGCQASGSALRFLMNYQGLGFVEAVEELADHLALEVPREGGTHPDAPADLTPLYDILEESNKHFQRQLRQHPEATRAVEYLKQRGLTGEVAARFQIGFAPPGWDALSRTLGSSEARREQLKSAGLVAERGTGSSRRQYDRFRDRIIFPIRDYRGRIVGFGGRVLDGDGPKYLNSPETPVFHKGRELYGLYQARQVNAKPERLLVVEGYMDVVALAQFGIDYAVATLGTAATRDHLERLFRVSHDVIFCFDGDAAGRRAAWRALETALAFMRDGRSAFFLFMPEGMDPDDYVRQHGAQALATAVATATPLSAYLFEHLAAEVDLTTLEGRSRLVEQCRPLAERVPAGPFRELLNSRLAELSKLNPEKLTRLLHKHDATRPKHRPGRLVEEAFLPSRGPSLVRRAVHLLVHDPGLLARVGDCEEVSTRIGELDLRGIPLLVALLDLLVMRPELSTGAVLEHFCEHELGQHLSRLAATPPPVLETVRSEKGNGLDVEFRGILAKLEAAVTERRYDALANKEGPLTDTEKAELRLLLKERTITP